MKTREEICEHLLTIGYTENARTKIMGFLIGKDLKAPEEVFTVLRGIGTFEDFHKWFFDMPNDVNYEEEEMEAIVSILNDVVARRDTAHSLEEYEYYQRQLEWLIYLLDVEVEFEDEDDENEDAE